MSTGTLTVSPARRGLRGTTRIPADKSISHRALLLSTLAQGSTRIENFLWSTTTRATLDCLSALGAEIETTGGNSLVVHGRGLRSLTQPAGDLFCQGSGTTMRLLAGLCAGQPFPSILDGTPALRRRPMARVAEPLRQMGASIAALGEGGRPPLSIQGAQELKGMEHRLPVASAQVKSALLLAGLYADGPTTIREPSPSRDHTERMLGAFGVQVRSLAVSKVRLEPAPLAAPGSALVLPNDFSSAAFFIAGALLVPGSELCLPRVGLNPTRTGLLDMLQAMGARVETDSRNEVNGEPLGDLVIRSASTLRGVEVSGALIPRMIDEFPIFAVVATQAEGETHVRDAAELRVKESDRIAALAAELGEMGAQIEERPDGFTIAGPTPLRGARVDAHGDHRLAMSLAVAGLLAVGETIVHGWDCVDDSFPDFERALFGLTT